MPTWGEILKEVQQSAQERGPEGPDFDGIRRKYLANLHTLTGRPVILYSTDWFQSQDPAVAISLEDMQGMMEVCKDLSGPALDVILHSPGGQAEAAASIVRYLRSKFTEIRVFVPLAAMSAATMWALSANVIVMGKHSQLGPIDPQVIMGEGAGRVPARALIEEFDRAKEEIATNPQTLGAWLPILQKYPAGVLTQAETADELARRLVEEWLAVYMFGGREDAQSEAQRIAAWFGDYGTHRSHSMGISRDQAEEQGLTIEKLEADQTLQDAVLSVHHATMHSFAGAAVKIIENHLGRAFIKLAQAIPIAVPIPPGPIPQQPQPPSGRP